MRRRDILKQMGLGAVLAGSVSKRQSLESFILKTEGSESPWWLLAPLKEGDSVGKGWKIESLSTIEKGACVLGLKHSSGEMTDIHICAKEGNKRGVASSSLLDLVLMDGRQGTEATSENLGRVVMGLAQRMQKNEMSLGADLSELTALQSHDERVYRYGPENLG